MAAPPPMGSSTDESDWNRPSYPKLKPANPHLHSLEQPKKEIRFSPQRNLTPQHPPKNSIKPRSVAPSQTLQSIIPVTAAPPFLPTTPNVTFTPVPIFSAPAVNPPPPIVNEAPVEAGLGWEAARESVVNQMMTTPAISTPATVPQTKRAKTGGRRGRGGRHAGGRPPNVKLETAVTTPTGPGDEPTPSSTKRGRGRGKGTNIGRGRGFGGGRPRGSRTETSMGRDPHRGIKRKREDAEEGDKDDTDASETYMPLPTQSRSGRKISKVATLTPVPRTVIDLGTDTEATPTVKPKSMEKVGSAKKEKGKRRYRKPGEASVCKNCGRGHSPASNAIVFCDGCNTPWHQYCHDPPIPWDVVRIEEQEWHCADCEVLREERVHLEGKTSAQGMNLVEKRRYFQSLPAAHLVSLLLHASTLHPTLPIFGPQKSILAPLQPNTLPPPVHPDFPSRTTNPAVTAEEDETYYELPSDFDPLPYPKPGNGIRLPPEDEDLALLVDEDVGVFSHMWRGQGRDVWGMEGVERMEGVGMGRMGVVV